jgi:hypothetical protein
MRVARYYTIGLESPYQGVVFRKLPYLDGDKAAARLGDVRYAESCFEVPDGWPEDVCATFFRRCAAHAGVPIGDRMEFPKAREDDVPPWLLRSVAPDAGRFAGETSARQTIDRLASDLTWWGWKAGYFDSDTDADAFFDELRYMLCHRLVAPELSLWSRIGRNWAHGAAWDDATMFVTDYRTARAVKADARHAANRSDEPWSVAVFDLRAFLGSNCELDSNGLAHGARLWTMALDLSIHATAHGKPLDAERDWSQRPIALETANLSSLLLSMGLAYDSDGGREICAGAMALLTGAAHAASAEMAGEIGVPPGAAKIIADPLAYVTQCRRAAESLPNGELNQAARRCWGQALSDGERHGFRNLEITVTASRRDACRFLDTEAGGIEPGYALAKFSRPHGGGLTKHMNPQVLSALNTLGYNPAQIEDITRHVLGRGTLETAPGINHQIMIMAGFGADAVLAAEAASGVVTDIRHALGVDDPRLEKFSRDQIEQATRYCCGAMSFDGAPHIKPDHLAIFQWSRDATESADRMRRAAQPFLDHPNETAVPASQPGTRRGRFMVYDGGATKDQPTEDRPAKTR